MLISSVIQIRDRSLSSSLIGIVAGAAARILPIRRPFAKVVKRLGGIPKLSLLMRAALVLEALANLCKYGKFFRQ